MFRRRRKIPDFAAEIESHLELEQDALRHAGLTEAEARAAAFRAFGNRTSSQERFYERHRWLWLDHLIQDLRFAARTLRRSPGFAAAAILTLALGIGANTAIFSALDDALLRPFPLPEPHQLAQVYSFNKRTNLFVSTSYPDYEDFSRRARSFEQLSAYVRMPLNVTIRMHTAQFIVEGVTGNYFAMLELPALLGRTLDAADDAPGAEPAAMIGETFWRDELESDPSIIGKPLDLDNHLFRVVGVVPKVYRGINLNWYESPRIWIPIHATPLVVPGFATADIFHHRSMPFVPLAGRLRAGVTPARAEAELRTIAASLAQSEPATNRDLTAAVFELSRSKFWPSYRKSVTVSLAVLSVAAGFVLLLACANISNLLLQRALGRRREFAIRLALGAGRRRLLGQLMAEGFLLIAPSFGLALLVAQGLGKILLRFPGAFGLDLALDLSIEGRALVFCAVVTLGAALLFGLAPAVQAIRPEVAPDLKDVAGSVAASRFGWLRQSLVVIQIAFCFILLVGGGLFAQGLRKAYSIDIGFRPQNLLILTYGFPQSQIASVERVRSFKENVVRQVSTVGGVETASLAVPPLTPFRAMMSVADLVTAEFENVGPGFFRTAGIPVLRGREFGAGDRPDAPRVALINQTLAALLPPGIDVVGRVVKLSQGPPAQIVGIVGDLKYHSVWDQAHPHLYLNTVQSRAPGGTIIARTVVRPELVIPAIREQWDRIAPGVPLLEIHTGEEQVNRSLAPQRAAAGLLNGFALLAIVLASIGLYGAMAHSVAQRTREIGIRMAIGARPGSVVGQILRRAMRWTAFGIAAGAAAAWMLTGLLASQLQGVSPRDTGIFAFVMLLVSAVSLAAAWLPARRAARIDPAKTLRCE